MRFRPVAPDEPEINLIPFIDVLLVVLIFLMLSTTYHKFTEMQLRLPSADTEALKDRPAEMLISVSRDGRYSLNRQPLDIRTDGGSPGRSHARQVELLAQQLQQGSKGQKDLVVVISADAAAPHQSVITVMEAARRAGLAQLTFATQSSAQAQAVAPGPR